MFNLFNKGSKVKEGKQKKEKQTTAAVSAAVGKKGAPKFAALQDAFKKLNKMDRKQAYTWGAVALVVLVGLVVLGSAVGSNGEEDFADFETRGYDLASMPFSTDEAEKYLLASKYPDMKETDAIGLYSKEEKEARQAEDEIPFETESANTSTASSGGYYGGGYGGGYSGGSRGGSTPINSLNSAGLKGSSGSGINSTFGPKGDFSNFRSQERGNDKFVPQKGKKADARTALFQTAKASRAAAGLKNDKLLNAKKSMMGGNIKGSDAFADDSGRVNLSSAGGLELDTNAPVETADLSGLDDAVNDAKTAAEEKAQDEEDNYWEQALINIVENLATNLINMGMDLAKDAIRVEQQAHAEATAKLNADAMDAWNKSVQGGDNKVMDVSSMDVNDFGKFNDSQLNRMNVTRTGDAPISGGVTGTTYKYNDQSIALGDDGQYYTGDGKGNWTKAEAKPTINLGDDNSAAHRIVSRENAQNQSAFIKDYKSEHRGTLKQYKQDAKSGALSRNGSSSSSDTIYTDEKGDYRIINGQKHYVKK